MMVTMGPYTNTAATGEQSHRQLDIICKTTFLVIVTQNVNVLCFVQVDNNDIGPYDSDNALLDGHLDQNDKEDKAQVCQFGIRGKPPFSGEETFLLVCVVVTECLQVVIGQAHYDRCSTSNDECDVASIIDMSCRFHTEKSDAVPRKRSLDKNRTQPQNN